MQAMLNERNLTVAFYMMISATEFSSVSFDDCNLWKYVSLLCV
jgi:hypothetical protein